MSRRFIALVTVLCILLLLPACAGKDPLSSSIPNEGQTSDSGLSSGSTEDTQPIESTDSTDKPSSTQTQLPEDPSVTSSKTTTVKPKDPTERSESVSAIIEKKMIPLYAGEEGVLQKNPDRGFRLEVTVDVQQLSTNKTYEKMKEEAASFIDKQILGQKEPVTLAQSYLYLSGYCDRDITEKGLQAIEAYLETLKDKKMKALLRFAYAKDPFDSENDAEQSRILRHMDQLAPIVNKWKDTIHALQFGLIGAWGEWHSEYFPLDRTAIALKMVNTMLPAGTYLQMRLPEYKNLIPSSHAAYSRIGIHNDSVFGKIPDKGYLTGGLDAGTAQWQQLVMQAAYAPQDGELYWSFWNQERNIYCDGLDAIKQFSEHRFTSLSILHGYRDEGGTDDTTMGRWKKQTVTTEWLTNNGIIGSPSFFKSKSGGSVQRNVFEFVWYHLGYYIEAQSVKVAGESKAGGAVTVTLPIRNYGFSAAFNMKSGFAILDQSGKVVSSVESGDPKTWYNRSATNYSDSTVLTHTLTVKIKLPSAHGRYKLAFYLKNNNGEFARIANQVDVVNGYNVLHEFDV